MGEGLRLLLLIVLFVALSVLRLFLAAGAAVVAGRLACLGHIAAVGGGAAVTFKERAPCAAACRYTRLRARSVVVTRTRPTTAPEAVRSMIAVIACPVPVAIAVLLLVMRDVSITSILPQPIPHLVRVGGTPRHICCPGRGGAKSSGSDTVGNACGLACCGRISCALASASKRGRD
jgi:hypothetical protein